MSSIFLSHNHADKPFARRLAQDLQAAGARVWLDEREIKLGDSLIEKIRQGIDEMEYFGAILSKHSVQSRWVQEELDTAMSLQIEGKRIKVLPLVIEDCELPGFLKGKLYADFRNKRRNTKRYKEELEKILQRLGITLKFQRSNLPIPDTTPPVPQENTELSNKIVNMNEKIQATTKAMVPYNKGHSLFYQQKPKDAINEYTKSINIDPEFYLAYYDRGVVYVNLEEYEKAIPDLKRSIELYNEFSNSYYFLGFVYHSQNKLDMAMANYTKAINTDPPYADAYFQRAEIYKMQGDTSKAESDMRRFYELKRQPT
jgi:tetratricopeptide (TPR) repeat protein